MLGSRGLEVPLTHYSNTPSPRYSILLGEHLHFCFHCLGRNNVAFEVHFFRVEAQGQADELRQMQNRQVNFLPGLRFGSRLVAVEIEVTKRTRCHHKIGAFFFGLAGVFRHHRKGVFLVRRQYRKSTAFSLAANIGEFGAHDADDLIQITSFARWILWSE